MKANFSLLVLFVLLLSPAYNLLARQAEPVDKDVVALIREQGLDNSHVMEYLSWMTDVYGGRLTGSPAIDGASKWALGAFEEMGLENVHKESWGPFGRGWTVEHFNVQASTEYGSFSINSYPKAWSPGTDGHVSGEAVMVSAETEEELEAYRGKLAGKIVLMQNARELKEPFEGLATRRSDSNLLAMANAAPRSAGGRGGGRRYSEEAMRRFQLSRKVQAFVINEKPLAVLDRGRNGDYGTIFVSGAAVPTPPDAGFFGGARAYEKDAPETVPQLTASVEPYNRMIRLLEKNIPVTIDLMLKVKWTDDDPMEYNLFGEIPGTDPEIGKELVMVGGHFDSWHSGTGATDDGSGSAVMMEVMRILKSVYASEGRSPRRTIRIGLWTGEEQGLLGSRAYVNDHFAETAERGQAPTSLKPEHETFSAYYNLDNGSGKIRGVYMQGNSAVEPIFRRWLLPFADLGASTLTINNTGGTDHLAFDAVGLPGFQFIQEPIAYSTKTHHSNMDVYDHTIAEDLKQAATIIASFVYNTAERDQKMPRKPLPRPQTEPAHGG
jgi:carboxypeptidase Q